MTASRFVSNCLLVLFLAVAAACAPVRLVSGYDEQSDQALTSLYASTSAFTDRMVALRGTPEGTWSANRAFYADARGQVDALILRSEAQRVTDSCPTVALAAKVLAEAGVPGGTRERIAALPTGDCQTGLYRLIRSNYDEMETAHRSQGALGIAPFMRDQFMVGGVGSLLGAALKVQVAKKAAAEGGGR